MLCIHVVEFLNSSFGCNVRSVVRMCYANRTEIHCVWSSSAQGRMKLMGFTLKFTHEVWTHGFIDVLLGSQKGMMPKASKIWT